MSRNFVKRYRNATSCVPGSLKLIASMFRFKKGDRFESSKSDIEVLFEVEDDDDFLGSSIVISLPTCGDDSIVRMESIILDFIFACN